MSEETWVWVGCMGSRQPLHTLKLLRNFERRLYLPIISDWLIKFQVPVMWAMWPMYTQYINLSTSYMYFSPSDGREVLVLVLLSIFDINILVNSETSFVTHCYQTRVWGYNKRPTGLNGHLSIRDFTLLVKRAHICILKAPS